MLKQFLRDYFSFSAKERRAVIFLVLFIFILILVPAFFPSFIGSPSTALVDSVQSEIVVVENKRKEEQKESMLNPDYVDNTNDDKSEPVTPMKESKTIVTDISKQTDINKVDINTTGIEELMKISGLDERIAKRILTFRDKLGGFYSIEQVRETYGLDSAAFDQIRPLFSLGAGVFRKININTADFDELRAHPYIRYQLANAIIEQRESAGGFESTEAIQKIQLVTPEIYSKLAAYLKTH